MVNLHDNLKTNMAALVNKAYFSWDMKMSQEKSKTMPMQVFFFGIKEVYYGIEKVA